MWNLPEAVAKDMPEYIAGATGCAFAAVVVVIVILLFNSERHTKKYLTMLVALPVCVWFTVAFWITAGDAANRDEYAEEQCRQFAVLCGRAHSTDLYKDFPKDKK